MLPFCLDGYREEPNNFYLEEWTTPHSTWDSVRGKRTSCRRVWSRGPFGELKSSPHSWIFTSVSVDPAYSLPLRCEYLFTLHQSVAQHPSDVWRSTLRSAASIRYRNRAAKKLSVIVYSGGQHRDALQNAIAWFFTKITFTLLHKANIFWQLNLYLKQNSSAGLLNQRQRPSKTIFVYHFFAVKLLEYALRWNYSHGLLSCDNILGLLQN